MSTDAGPDQHALFLAEEVLRTIYGDDYKGCTVRPEDISAVIRQGLERQQAQSRDLIELYEKVVEAAHLLSTPPDASKVTEPGTLRSLLSERLDGIHAITTKTMETTSRVRKNLGKD
ncbi:MAG TPA: hypothetical protein VN578_25435 [Candidatus Binatia bacterium]|jgi:hypothetical protein|nr:hypothetical protein [Candidatus Binatia bacterium]